MKARSLERKRRSLYEFFVCLTHPAFKELDDALEVRHVLSSWHNVEGWTIWSCRVCQQFHLRKPRLAREQRRLIWFIFCAVAVCLGAVGASVFNSLFWFCSWELIGMLIVTVATFYQYGKL